MLNGLGRNGRRLQQVWRTIHPNIMLKMVFQHKVVTIQLFISTIQSQIFHNNKEYKLPQMRHKRQVEVRITYLNQMISFLFDLNKVINLLIWDLPFLVEIHPLKIQTSSLHNGLFHDLHPLIPDQNWAILLRFYKLVHDGRVISFKSLHFTQLGGSTHFLLPPIISIIEALVFSN